MIDESHNWPCVFTNVRQIAPNMRTYHIERIPGPQTINQHWREQRDQAYMLLSPLKARVYDRIVEWQQCEGQDHTQTTALFDMVKQIVSDCRDTYGG